MSEALVIAHRGASGHRPEHTRGAYEQAIALGADAIEPDLVFSKDGVLVIRHENEISETTDVASREEFVSRKTTKVVDGESLTGWFTEDFTWAELSTLTCVERLPELRPSNTASQYAQPMLRFIDLLEIVDQCDRKLSLVVEIKHPTYFEQLGLHFTEAIATDLYLAGWQLNDERICIESFEKSVVVACKEKGIGSSHFYIMDYGYTAYDEIVWAMAEGVPSISNPEELSEAGLEVFSQRLDGLALAWSLLLGRETVLDVERAKHIVARAHELGLKVFIWTMRPENEFLPKSFRIGDDPAEHGQWESFFSLLWSLGIDGAFADHPDLAVRTRP